MKSKIKYKQIRILGIITFIGIGAISTINAQSTRSLVNEGVDLYEAEQFADAEVKFKKSAEKEFENFNSHFNLGDALYKQERYDEAIQSFKNAMVLTEDEYDKSKSFHNIGNSFLKSQKFEESIEAYKNALKLNPDDIETKYNLSYALEQMKQDQDQQKNQDKNQDQNKDQNKDKQQKQDQDKQDQNKDKQEQNKDQQKQDQNQQNKDQNENQDQQQQQPQPKDQISKEEAQRILEALKNNESDLQKKLRKKKGKVVKKEKDW